MGEPRMTVLVIDHQEIAIAADVGPKFRVPEEPGAAATRSAPPLTRLDKPSPQDCLRPSHPRSRVTTHQKPRAMVRPIGASMNSMSTCQM